MTILGDAYFCRGFGPRFVRRDLARDKNVLHRACAFGREPFVPPTYVNPAYRIPALGSKKRETYAPDSAATVLGDGLFLFALSFAFNRAAGDEP